jgi:hypothetical protein
MCIISLLCRRLNISKLTTEHWLRINIQKTSEHNDTNCSEFVISNFPSYLFTIHFNITPPSTRFTHIIHLDLVKYVMIIMHSYFKQNHFCMLHEPSLSLSLSLSHTHTHTHTRTYMCIHIYAQIFVQYW